MSCFTASQINKAEEERRAEEARRIAEEAISKAPEDKIGLAAAQAELSCARKDA